MGKKEKCETSARYGPIERHDFQVLRVSMGMFAGAFSVWTVYFGAALVSPCLAEQVSDIATFLSFGGGVVASIGILS